MIANVRSLCKELAIKARVELNEVESRIPEDITTLSEWILKQPHLRARTNDQFLLAFLRGCKYSLEKAKQKIDFYYTIKALEPDLFLYKQIDDKTIRLAKEGPFLPLPNPFKVDGSRLHLIRYGHINFKEFNMVDVFKMQIRITDIELFEDDSVVIGGAKNVVDLKNLSLRFFTQLDPVLIKKIIVFADKAVPFRLKGVHVINCPKEFASVYNTFRSLMPKKMAKRVYIHDSLESLYKQIPREFLPEEYGGKNGQIEEIINQWKDSLERYKDFFEEELKYVADEKLREEGQQSFESVFGLEGSFRKLEVD